LPTFLDSFGGSIAARRWPSAPIFYWRVLQIFVSPRDMIDDSMTDDLYVLDLDDLTGATLESL
jgi:hypothetical protein